MFSTLLNGVTLHPIHGTFRLNQIQAVFLPEADTYTPETGGSLTSVLKRSDGTTVAEMVWYAEKLRAPFWLLSSYKLRIPDGDWDQIPNFKLTTAGEYIIDFLLDGNVFYSFPFSVEALGSDDPYNPQTLYRTNGAWLDYAYMYYAEANPARPLLFKLWLRNDGERRKKDVKVTGSLKRNGKEIARFGEFPRNLSLSADWVRYEFELGQFKDTQFNTKVYHNMLKASELLVDGKYTISMEIDGRNYGTWNYSVKDNKIEHQGRQARATTDPLEYIEGGRDAFWMSKQ